MYLRQCMPRDICSILPNWTCITYKTELSICLCAYSRLQLMKIGRWLSVCSYNAPNSYAFYWTFNIYIVNPSFRPFPVLYAVFHEGLVSSMTLMKQMLYFKQLGCAEAHECCAASKWNCEGEWMKSRGGCFPFSADTQCFAVGQTVLEIAWLRAWCYLIFRF